ncbi:MAG TPA: phosphatase PAP2 family protein [Pirellulaceae bacterium]|nr:phosphatase PAP2 family protein [Pirellulaceae bacterium]
MALVLAVLAAAATQIDLPLARVFQPRKANQKFYPALGKLTKVVNLSEAFSYGGTVLLLVVLAGRLDAAGPRAMPRLLAGAFGGGLAANVVKLLLSRARPKAAELEGNVMATFQDWLPLAGDIHNFQSFPSAHTGTAFGLATVLTWKYPRAGLVFFALAAVAGLQRIQVMDHFASDVLVGAALGLACGAACVHQRLLGGVFDRLETVAAVGPHRVD